MCVPRCGAFCGGGCSARIPLLTRPAASPVNGYTLGWWGVVGALIRSNTLAFFERKTRVFELQAVERSAGNLRAPWGKFWENFFN